jgi:phenylalanyl-tRNA synthetase beta chain
MRIPADWINEYVPNELSVRDLAYILTNVGLEVEAIAEGSATAVFDIKVTPNRGDCLSVLGVARELGMALRKPVQDRMPSITESGPTADSLVKITLDDPELCPRYSARLVRGVKIGPSPEWARRRLELCGLRPINNVVDATNLVMLELGQPLHAFDYLLLTCKGDEVSEIIVRRAQSGERLVTIDGEERALTPDLLLITDASGPIAVAGVMGGASTEINDGTTEVLLESAHFDPSTIRKGARALGQSTEASYRFERTVDPGGTIRALDRACELIVEFWGRWQSTCGAWNWLWKRERDSWFARRPSART